jgi:competence protein ComEC
MWKKQPALFYGIYVLLGAAFAIFPHWIYAIPALAFLHLHRRTVIALAVMGLTFFYAKSLYSFPELGEEKIKGKGVFSVDSVTLQTSPFHRSLLYQGTVKNFTSDDGRFFENIPCRIYLSPKAKRPLASSDLPVTGTLLQKHPKKYVLKLTSWETATTNSAEWRFWAQTHLTDYLKGHFPDKNVRTFLLSMLTGEIEERVLSIQFNKLGLQHILGVSGFQFVILAAFLGIILRLFFSYRPAAMILIGLLTLYFFFLGGSPPVFRAWIAIVIFFIGFLSNKRSTALNALGIALIVEILFDPLVISNIGFQLSFLCTAAILILFPLMRRTLVKILPVRPFKEVRQMSLWDQHGYLATAMIRESLALNFAVHLMALPLLLSLFGKFPLMSLVYNLFFPLCATISFILLLVGMIIPGVHALNCFVTKGFLAVVTNPPAMLDFSLRINPFPMEMTIILLTTLLLFVLDPQKDR